MTLERLTLTAAAMTYEAPVSSFVPDETSSFIGSALRKERVDVSEKIRQGNDYRMTSPQ